MRRGKTVFVLREYIPITGIVKQQITDIAIFETYSKFSSSESYVAGETQATVLVASHLAFICYNASITSSTGR